jgi:hypothetical protein
MVLLRGRTIRHCHGGGWNPAERRHGISNGQAFAQAGVLETPAIRLDGFFAIRLLPSISVRAGAIFMPF